VQGERELAKDCRSLGRFELTDIPLMPAGKARIEVTYQIDLDGLLVVSARETSTGKENTLQVKPTYGLQQRDVIEAIETAILHANEDKKEKQLQLQQQELERQRRMNETMQRALAGRSIDEVEKILS
jgi:molecular chaperone HscA